MSLGYIPSKANCHQLGCLKSSGFQAARTSEKAVPWNNTSKDWGRRLKEVRNGDLGEMVPKDIDLRRSPELLHPRDQISDGLLGPVFVLFLSTSPPKHNA